MMTPQEKHDKYVEAAMMIDCEFLPFSCWAVNLVFAGNIPQSSASKEYKDAMQHGGPGSFLGAVMDAADYIPAKGKELRVMLLLFAAQMARTGDL